ncbi:hypothetical protein [Dactylosporangium sp. NPDC005555]|uniref:hypothetical protein n=1 Tax=Dactylosporangium sp. NPDC005555 TaxID=3154889 RepID=UPI0033B41AE7
MASPVPWHELSADQIERLVAAWIIADHPGSQRVNGSGGDDGADVRQPVDGGLRVFEIKSFRDLLTPGQKRNIGDSLRNAVRHQAGMLRWTLVVPRDLTPAEIRWFEHDLAPLTTARIDWIGLTELESGLSRHPKLLALTPGSAERRAIDIVSGLGLRSLRTLVIVSSAVGVVIAAALGIGLSGRSSGATGSSGPAAARSAGTPDGGAPLAAVTSARAVGCRSGWVVPDPGDTPVPFDPHRPPAKAVLSGGGEVTVTVQGLTGRSVVLQSMTVEVLHRSPALTGVHLPFGCQGVVPPRKYRLDLDAAAPRITPEAGTATFPYRVDEVEPEQFLITPDVTTGDIEWRLLLQWTSGADEGTLILPEAGKAPFRFTATTAARTFCFDINASVWRPSC